MPAPQSYSDNELFRLMADGSELAFSEFYQSVLPALSGFAFKLLKSEMGVQEVIQESLIRLWLQRDKLAAIEFPRSWFFSIVTNECFRYLKKHGLNNRLLEDLKEHADTPSGNTTELDLSLRETQRVIHQIVESLSARQRQIYRLSRDQGLPLSDIASQLGVSTNYVRKTITLTLAIIRRRLKEAGLFILLICWWLLSIIP